MGIGERLRWARESAGISQRKLARLAGLKSEMHVRIIEGGDAAKGIESTTAIALATALGVSLDWLLTGGEPQPSADAIREAIASIPDEQGAA